MNKIGIYGIVIFLSLSTLSIAQTDTVTFNLSKAQEYALEHNKELLNAREDIAISEAEYKETRSQGLPQVSGSMDYTTNFNYEFELGVRGGGVSMPDINFGLLDQGDQEVLSAIQQMMEPSGPSTIVMEDQMNAQVRVSQLIFSGQYWIGLETARIAEELARKQVKKTKLDVKQQVTNTYYLILISERSLDILQKNLSNLKEVLEHTRNMYQMGMVEQTDVDQIRMDVSKLKNSLESTRRNIRMNYKMLKIQLGLDQTQAIALQDSLSSVLSKAEGDLLGEELQLDNNPSFQMVRSREHLQKKQVDLQKWAYAPTISGYYSYTEKIMTTAFDLSPKHAAGITLSLPIYTGGSRQAKISKAQIELDKTQRQKALLKDKLKLQENQLKTDLKSALENYQTQKENVEVAENVYDNIYDKYKQGAVSSMDLTQANSNYLEAKSNYISSIIDLLQAKLALEKLYGTL